MKDVLSFRAQLEQTIEELSVYRRALRGEDRIAFDNIMDKARKHAQSCSILSFDPFDCILLSVLIEQEKEIRFLKEKIEKLHER